MSLRLALPSEGALFEGASQFMASCGLAGFAGEFEALHGHGTDVAGSSRCCSNDSPT